MRSWRYLRVRIIIRPQLPVHPSGRLSRRYRRRYIWKPDFPRFYDQAKWTGLRTGSASRTFFLVDHVNALRVLGDGAFRTGLGTFTALRTGDRANSLFLYDLQTCLVRIKYLIKCLRTCSHTGKTSHTGTAFFNFQFFHLFYPPLKVCVFLILPFLTFFLNDISGICHLFPACGFSSVSHGFAQIQKILRKQTEKKQFFFGKYTKRKIGNLL